MREPEVGKIQKIFFELFRARVNFVRKQKVDFQNFVPEGHPRGGANSQVVGRANGAIIPRG